MLEKYRVSTELLTNKCNFDLFNFETTETIPVTRELIGQERAMEALKFGLTINRKGYNIYVSGLTGTGRNSYSYLVAKSFADKKEIPNDWCYVFNFRKPESPKAISLSAGMGRIFKKEVEKAFLDIKIDIPKVLTSKEYEDAKNEQGFIEGQILETEKILRNARVIDEQDINPDVVNVGSKVTLIDVDNKTEFEYMIVGSAEADPAQAKISNESPVGRSLMGKKVGNIVNVEVPIGTIQYKIKAISK